MFVELSEDRTMSLDGKTLQRSGVPPVNVVVEHGWPHKYINNVEAQDAYNSCGSHKAFAFKPLVS